MTKRITPHRNIQFVWQRFWHYGKPSKTLRRGRADERICWRYGVIRLYLAAALYLLAVPGLIALIARRVLDYLFIVQHKRQFHALV